MDDKITKHPGGRPTKFVPEMVDKALKMAKAGLTVDQIAALLDISIDSIYEYGRLHPEFSESIKRGRAAAGGRTVLTAFQLANGYWGFDSTGAKCWYPPNPTMVIFLGKNFGGLKDRVDSQVTVKHAPALDMTKLSDAELELFLKLAEKAAPENVPALQGGE